MRWDGEYTSFSQTEVFRSLELDVTEAMRLSHSEFKGGLLLDALSSSLRVLELSRLIGKTKEGAYSVDENKRHVNPLKVAPSFMPPPSIFWEGCENHPALVDLEFTPEVKLFREEVDRIGLRTEDFTIVGDNNPDLADSINELTERLRNGLFSGTMRRKRRILEEKCRDKNRKAIRIVKKLFDVNRSISLLKFDAWLSPGIAWQPLNSARSLVKAYVEEVNAQFDFLAVFVKFQCHEIDGWGAHIIFAVEDLPLRGAQYLGYMWGEMSGGGNLISCHSHRNSYKSSSIGDFNSFNFQLKLELLSSIAYLIKSESCFQGMIDSTFFCRGKDGWA